MKHIPVKVMEVDWEDCIGDITGVTDPTHLPEGKTIKELVSLAKDGVAPRTLNRRMRILVDSGEWIQGWKYTTAVDGKRQHTPSYRPKK